MVTGAMTIWIANTLFTGYSRWGTWVC